jgi:hypothetical protein
LRLIRALREKWKKEGPDKAIKWLSVIRNGAPKGDQV